MKSYILFLFLFLFLFASFTSLKAQEFWVSTQDGGNVDETLGIASDAEGNSYLTGYFSTTANISGENLSSSGLTDVYVAKLGPNGSPIWRAKAGGTLSDRGLGVASDADGNLIVCGFFTGTIDFGNGITLSAEGDSQDAFVAKYSTGGQTLWAHSGGSASNADRANAVATDAAGRVYITGQYSGAATFSGQTINATGISTDIFTACYSPSGILIWLKSSSGPGANRGLGIAASAGGEVYITGSFSETITFDVVHPNPIINALFLVKYSTTGQELWFRYAGGSDQGTSYAVAEHDGSVYITGDCGGTLTFFNNTTFPVLENPYENGVFLAKFSAAGQYAWGRVYGSDSFIGARGLACNADKVVMTGWYECKFDSLSNFFGERIFYSVGNRDVFLISHGAQGNYNYSNSAGGPYDDLGYGVTIPTDGYEVVCGTFDNRFTMPASSLDLSITGAQQTGGGGQTFCGFTDYGSHSEINPDKGFGGFAFKGFEPAAGPLDLFPMGDLADCDFSMPSAEILSPDPDNPGQPIALDTIYACPGLALSHTQYISGQWHYEQAYTTTFNPTQYITDLFNGNVTLSIERNDGCFTKYDTVFVEISPNPNAPLISDSWGLYDSASAPIFVHLCPGDTILFSAHYDADLSCSWSPNNELLPFDSDSLYVYDRGTYFATTVDQAGCENSTPVEVQLSVIPPDTIAPYLVFVDDDGTSFTALDTLSVCADRLFSAIVRDSIADEWLNPNPDSWPDDFSVTWWVNGNLQFSTSERLDVANLTAGWNYVEALIAYADTLCFDNPETYFTADSVFIIIDPEPVAILTLFAQSFVCPGTVYPVIVNTNGNPNYYFGISGSSGDTLFTSETGLLSAQLTLTNAFGCTDIQNASIYVESASTPIVSTDPAEAVICPGESVELTVATNGSPTWIGPQGEAGTDSSIDVTDPGLYYAEVNFYPGCDLVSNTVQVSGYATPYITAWPPTLCLTGGSVTLNLIATNPISIEWFAPLTGSAMSQVITEPGVYGAQVESCGIFSQVYITVEYGNATVEITVIDSLPVCSGDFFTLEATPGFLSYNWSDGNNGESISAFTNGLITVSALDPFGCYVVADSVELNFEPLPPLADIEYSSPCLGEEAIITTEAGDFTVLWYYNGDTILTDELYFASISQPTSFAVELQSEYCTGPLLTATIEPQDVPGAPVVYADSIVCTTQGLNLEVFPFDPDAIYHWLTPTGYAFSGGPVQTYGIQGPENAGFYLAWGVHGGCSSDTTEILVQVLETVQPILEGDTVVCSGSEFILDPMGGQFMAYFWQDGSTDSVYVATEPGIFTVLTTDLNGCTAFASTEIGFVSCIVGLPNVFTPNGDGLNDIWLIDVYQPKELKVEIIDRWGRKVFASNSGNASWDGIDQSNGEASISGTYFYTVIGVGFLDQQIQAQGNLSLIRE